MPDVRTGTLFYGDSLDILGGKRPRIPPESVDLIYLDPPFNSKRAYNVFLPGKAGTATAQIHAFDDTWTWTQVTARAYQELLSDGGETGEAIQAFHGLLGETDLLAYLVMMATRLLLLKDVLKPTGSLYLHCDPTASHYLKLLLDAIFGPKNFRGEIAWKRTTTHNDSKKWSPDHDTLLFYSAGDTFTFNPVYMPHDPVYVEKFYKHTDEQGRRYQLGDIASPNPRPNLMYEWRGFRPPEKGWRFSLERMEELFAAGRIELPKKAGGRPRVRRYLDEMDGTPPGDVWTDIPPIAAQAAERLGYPTQKPLALLERIITASSNPGDVVLDPFCGCGTALVAAHKLGRRWIGIDIAYIAVDLMRTRLQDQFAGIELTVEGQPQDFEGATALFQANHFDFEVWAVSLVRGTPKRKPGGDKGVDGLIRFHQGKGAYGRVVVSVKGGDQLNPSFVRDLEGAVTAAKAEMGVLITRVDPTKGMRDTARSLGSYTWPFNGEEFPKIQIITIAELLAGGRPRMPAVMTPYVNAEPIPPGFENERLDLGAVDAS